MSIIQEINNWQGKPKELVFHICQKIANNPALMSEAVEILKSGAKTQRGTLADTIEELSKLKPELLQPHIATLIELVNDKLPRVKWGTQEALGNLSTQYPHETAKAIPKLLQNTLDDSTVVKWCAAYAISEIAKNNPQAQPALVPKMQQLANAEPNNGVKNVYLKALKKIKKI